MRVPGEEETCLEAVERTCSRPFFVKERSVVEVCWPVWDQVVWPWRRRKRRGVGIGAVNLREKEEEEEELDDGVDREDQGDTNGREGGGG